MKLVAIGMAALLSGTAAGEVAFSSRTIPETAELTAAVSARRDGDVWRIVVTAKNQNATNVTFRLALAAEPGFAATRYLIPGVNYNGNAFVQAIARDQHNPDRAPAGRAAASGSSAASTAGPSLNTRSRSTTSATARRRSSSRRPVVS